MESADQARDHDFGMPDSITPKARQSDHAIVPVEPNDDMLIAGQEAWFKSRAARPAIEDCWEAEAVYRAMIAVAPAAPPQAPVAWAIELADGTISRLGWQDFGTLDTMLRIAKLSEGARIVYAYRDQAPMPVAITDGTKEAINADR